MTSLYFASQQSSIRRTADAPKIGSVLSFVGNSVRLELSVLHRHLVAAQGSG